jgi:hypothetical protein
VKRRRALKRRYGRSIRRPKFFHVGPGSTRIDTRYGSPRPYEPGWYIDLGIGIGGPYDSRTEAARGYREYVASAKEHIR